MFLNEDILSSMTNIALKGNFDIIIFNSIYTDLNQMYIQLKFLLFIWN